MVSGLLKAVQVIARPLPAVMLPLAFHWEYHPETYGDVDDSLRNSVPKQRRFARMPLLLQLLS
jgi:hypothetical protein